MIVPIQTFRHLQVGDKVTRMLAGVVPCEMEIVEVTETRLRCKMDGTDCSDWEFDRETGVEEDAEIGWGKKFGVTGSYLKLMK